MVYIVTTSKVSSQGSNKNMKSLGGKVEKPSQEEILYDDQSSDPEETNDKVIVPEKKNNQVIAVFDDGEEDLFSDVLNQVNEFDCKIGGKEKEDKAALTVIEIKELERELPDTETIFTEEMQLIDEKSQKGTLYFLIKPI